MAWQPPYNHFFRGLIPKEVDAQAEAFFSVSAFAQVIFEQSGLVCPNRVSNFVFIPLFSGTESPTADERIPLPVPSTSSPNAHGAPSRSRA